MLTKLLSTSLVLIMLLSAVPVTAQDDVIDHAVTTYEVYKIPKGLRVRWSGESYQMYDLAEYKALLQVDADLKYYTEKKAELEGINYNLTVKVKSLNLAIVEVEEQRDTMREDRDRVHLKWKSDNKAKHVAENKPVFGSGIPWLISGGLAALSAGLIFALVAGGGD